MTLNISQEAGSTAESQSSQASEATSTQSTGTPQEGAAQSGAEGSAGENPDTGGMDAAALEAAAVAKYTPNYKFKAADKEQEFDEILKGVIKDQATEAKIRELYEKGHGIESVKAHRQELRQENRHLKEELGAFHSDVEELQSYYKQGDLDSFFQKLRVPEEMVYNWVIKKAQLKELPPEQQAIHEENRRMQQERRAYENMLREERNYRMQAEGQGRALELRTEFSKPSVQTFAKAFDSKVGKENAFYEAVCELGEYVLLKDKKNLTPAEAIQHVMSTYKNFIDQPQMGDQIQNPAQAGAAPAPGATQAPKVNVIPNVGGKSASPTARKFKTLDEIKEYAKTFKG